LRQPGFKVGREGLERTYEYELRGVAGTMDVKVNAHGRVIEEIEESVTPPKQGETLGLTIDADLQMAAMKVLEGESASAVVIDTETGDILVLASTPAFDPNIFTRGIPNALWKELNESPYKPLLNKPLGVTCSHKESGPLVYGLLPPRWRGRDPMISTVGRLDKETSGLLLMTDDGELLHRIISPRRQIAKRYRVSLERALAGNVAEVFASGTLMLESEDKPLNPALLEPIGEREAFLTITEGRYHQVRRMFAATGNHVTALHRDRIGSLELPADLEAGRYRVLTEAEIGAVIGAAGAPW